MKASFQPGGRKWAPGPQLSPRLPQSGFSSPGSLREAADSLEGQFSKWPPRPPRSFLLPRRPGRGRAARPGHGHSCSPGVQQSRPGGVGRRELGWVGGREEPERGAGRGTKGPFVTRGREKRERITQCPEAMLVTREPFSALLGKQLGAERDRERFNPMGAGTGA